VIPEVRANELLAEVGISSLPIDPIALAKGLDVEVKELYLGDACEGFLIVENHRAMIGISSTIKSEKRKTYTAAHELGHLCLDVLGAPNKKIECRSASIETYARGLPEIELRANRFASELLLPKILVADLVLNSDLGWTAIDEISNLADTSRTATARRFIQLTDEACALVVSQKGQVRWFAASPSFALPIDMDSRLLHAGGAADLAFKGKTVPNEFLEVPAVAWIRGHRSKLKDASLQEWSLPLNQYGQVLTILWDDQGVGDFDEDSVADVEGDEEEFDPRFGWETPTFGKKRR